MRLPLFALLSAFALSACGDNLTHPPDREAYDGGGEVPLSCVPNLDGKIDATELQAAIGVPVSFLVSPPGKESAVDLEGVVGDDGRRVWDWSVDVATDKLATIAASKLADKWYAASFPTGELVAPVDAGGSVEGVYFQDADAIYLLGVASAKENPSEGKTLLVYETPIAVYRFPLVPGAEWVSTSDVANATVRGLPYAGTDRYEVKDDGAGEIVLPAYTFTQVHRLRTRVLLSPSAGAATSTRQVSYFFECFGEVARATSRADEADENFKTASEVRRLGQ